MRQEKLCINFRRSSRQCKLYLPTQEEAMKDSGLILVIKNTSLRAVLKILQRNARDSRPNFCKYTYFTPRFFSFLFHDNLWVPDMCFEAVDIPCVSQKLHRQKSSFTRRNYAMERNAGFHINIQDSFTLPFRFWIYWHFNCVCFCQLYNDYLRLGFIHLIELKKNTTLNRLQSQR
jgi:hypothetical protein